MTTQSTKRIPTDAERSDILRTLTIWTQNQTAAEDLTQQTMLEAWKSERQPPDPEWRPWLFGIARNMFYRWRRDLARDLRRTIAMPETDAIFEATASDIDLDIELERNEIAALLHDLLDRLPKETRDILLHMYINELPQAAIAESLGLHEKAVEGRLFRGKRILRDQLLMFRADAAVELGIVTESNTWQQTVHWCPRCGDQQLLARWSDKGTLRFECPSCLDGARTEVYVGDEIQSRTLNRRPTYSRVMKFFSLQSDACVRTNPSLPVTCPACDSTMRYMVQRFNEPLAFEAAFFCNSCDAYFRFENLLECGIDAKAGVAFRLQHPRVAASPPTLINYQGMEAIQVRWIARDGSAELIAFHDPQLGYLIETV